MEHIERFRYYVQKVIPLIYADSLSYYEVLNKVTYKLNEVITALNEYSEEYSIKIADPITWDISKQYQSYTIVIDGNNGYISRQPVPANVPITDTDYWTPVFDLGDIVIRLKAVESEVAELSEKVENEKWVNVKAYGAKGDGVTDDTAILQEIADSGYNMYFPKGTYYISSTLEIGGSQMVLGSSEGSVIEQHSTNPASAVLAIGNRATVYAISLRYASDVDVSQATQENHFIGLCLHSINAPWILQRTGIYKVIVSHCGNGMSDWHPSLNSPSGMFSVGIHDCEIIGFTYSGISLTGGSTGDHLDNVYVNCGYVNGGTENARLNRATYGVHVVGNRALNCTNLNIEWGLFDSAPLCCVGSCIIGDSIHLEEVGIYSASYRGLIDLDYCDMELASVAFNFPWLYTTGTKLFILRNGGTRNPYSGGGASSRSEIRIGTLLLNGLNNPAWQIFPSQYFTKKGLDYAPSWGLSNRESNYGGEYGFSISNYTYNCPYSQDLPKYEDPPRDPHSAIDWIKLGDLPEVGPLASRPTKRVCKNHTLYYATNENGIYLFTGFYADASNNDSWTKFEFMNWRPLDYTPGEAFPNPQVFTARYASYRGLLLIHMQGTPAAGVIATLSGIARGGTCIVVWGNAICKLVLTTDGKLTLTVLSGTLSWQNATILMPLN